MFNIPGWIIAIIVFNIAVFLILLNPNPNIVIPIFSNNPNPINQTPNASNETESQVILNQSSNQTSNVSIYQLNCENSINNYIKTVENITNFTMKEIRFFNKSEDAIKYIERNWSSKFYELEGLKKDIYDIVKTKIVSVNNFTTNRGRDFTLPIVCDENGNVGKYSFCLLSNISNTPLACHNITVNLTECEIEKLEHEFLEDINYSTFPKPGLLNKTQLFNFTITSSRNRLEYAGMGISYRSSLGESLLFSQTKKTTTGDKISITTTLNLTGKVGGSVVAMTWFKKKCYDVFTIT
jgi:hypothetical protein